MEALLELQEFARLSLLALYLPVANLVHFQYLPRADLLKGLMRCGLHLVQAYLLVQMQVVLPLVVEAVAEQLAQAQARRLEAEEVEQQVLPLEVQVLQVLVK